MPKRKVIISCAVTGSIHTPSMSPYLPVTAEEISQAALEAAQAGAAIVHLHTRDPKDGRPSQDPALYEPFLKKINASSDVIINITTGGSTAMPVEERIRPAMEFQPELASLNMGSMNFATFPMLQRFTEFEHAWERDYLENSRDVIFKNTFKDIEHILSEGGRNGTRFEYECYDIGHLYSLSHFFREGLATAPLLIQSVMGILGGIGTHPEDLAHMRRTADRLFGDAYEWSVVGAGRHQMPLATLVAAQGGHVRVGLEDSLWLGPGQLANSSAQQVIQIRKILEGLGLEVATPDEAREMLKLKGRGNVGF